MAHEDTTPRHPKESMAYFVVMPDGQKYGPAETDLLNNWIQEGRLSANTILEDAQTGQRVAAGTVPGLNFAFAQPSPPPPTGTPRPFGSPEIPTEQNYNVPPSYSPYARHMMPGYNEEANKNVTYSWISAVAAFVCCPIIPPILGITFANKAKAMGHPSAQPAYIVNLVILILQILGLVAYLAVVVFVIMAAPQR